MNNLKLSSTSINTIFLFLLNIWIFTNIISSFLLLAVNDYFIDRFRNNITIIFEKDFWQDFFRFVLIGLIYSTPAMVILGLIIKLLTNNKYVLAFISIILVIGTFYFAGLMSLKNLTTCDLDPHPIIYSVVISSLILIINIGKREKTL